MYPAKGAAHADIRLAPASNGGLNCHSHRQTCWPAGQSGQDGRATGRRRHAGLPAGDRTRVGLPAGQTWSMTEGSPPVLGGSARRPTRRPHLPYGHHSATTWRACPTRLRRGCRAAARFHPQGVGYQYVDGRRVAGRRRHEGWATAGDHIGSGKPVHGYCSTASTNPARTGLAAIYAAAALAETPCRSTRSWKRRCHRTPLCPCSQARRVVRFLYCPMAALSEVPGTLSRSNRCRWSGIRQ